MANPVDAVVGIVTAVPTRYWMGLVVLTAGIFLGVAVGRLNSRLLRRAGVPEAVEGTAFERTLQDLGSSTVSVVAQLSKYFVWGFALIVALTVAELQFTGRFWNDVVTLLPRAFVAVLILIVGVVVGDKLDLLISERLTGLKVPEVGLVAPAAKYTVFYVAVLVALGQLGIATDALVVLFGSYVFGVTFLSAVAFRDLLASGAAGLWVLLHEPYGIGDRIRVGDREGIVQEVEVFVTTVEDDDGTEYVVPNRKVFQEGVVRLRS